MDWLKQRKQDLNENIREEYNLLKELEDQLRVENNIKEKEKINKEINEIRKRIDDHDKELFALKNCSIQDAKKELSLAMTVVTFRELEMGAGHFGKNKNTLDKRTRRGGNGESDRRNDE